MICKMQVLRSKFQDTLQASLSRRKGFEKYRHWLKTPLTPGSMITPILPKSSQPETRCLQMRSKKKQLSHTSTVSCQCKLGRMPRMWDNCHDQPTQRFSTPKKHIRKHDPS